MKKLIVYSSKTGTTEKCAGIYRNNKKYYSIWYIYANFNI